MVKKVAVLMAVYNGVEWLSEQIDSILSQNGDFEITIFVSVDKSTDGSEEFFEKKSSENKNIILLPCGLHFGGAAKNFYRLISDVDIEKFDFICLSDQDDIWFPDKIDRAIYSLHNYDAYSSNVIALWSTGRKELIEKSQPQVEFDYLFEAAGPGCTYVFSNNLMVEFKHFLNKNQSRVNDVSLHDWLIYAFARFYNYSWFIDYQPSMYYRQHSHNQVGANSSFTSALKRLKLIKGKWYKNEIKKIIKLLGLTAPRFIHCSIFDGYFGALLLAINVHRVRRRRRDRIALACVCILGIF